MSFGKLSRVDLNLLVCLYQLLDKQSVSKAAEHLHLSQSAISKSLAKLREIFDDPLLIRIGYRMEPTAKALQLKPELEIILSKLESLLSPELFVPQRCERNFNIAMVETTYPYLFQGVMSQLLSHAPKLTLSTSNWGKDTFALLQRRELDFAVTGTDLQPTDAAKTLQPPKGVVGKELYQDELCCLVRSQHPALAKDWNLSTYLESRHVVVKCYQQERWLLDMKLADHGYSRDVALIVPDFNHAAEVCCHSDVILTAPSIFSKRTAARLNLTLLPLPFEVPSLGYTLFWHQSQESDLAHSWFRQAIISHCQEQ